MCKASTSWDKPVFEGETVRHEDAALKVLHLHDLHL